MSTTFPIMRSESSSSELVPIVERVMETIFSLMDVTVLGNLPWVNYIINPAMPLGTI